MSSEIILSVEIDGIKYNVDELFADCEKEQYETLKLFLVTDEQTRTDYLKLAIKQLPTTCEMKNEFGKTWRGRVYCKVLIAAQKALLSTLLWQINYKWTKHLEEHQGCDIETLWNNFDCAPTIKSPTTGKNKLTQEESQLYAKEIEDMFYIAAQIYNSNAQNQNKTTNN